MKIDPWDLKVDPIVGSTGHIILSISFLGDSSESFNALSALEKFGEINKKKAHP